MNCEQAKPLLTDLALDEIENSTVRREVEAHVAGCEACRREMANWKMTRSLVAQGVPQEDPPHRIRFVGAERPSALAWLWAPGFRVPAGIGVAAALMMAVLAVSGARVTAGDGRLEIAFGRHPAVATQSPVQPQLRPQNVAGALPTPAVPAGQQAFTREEVQRIVSAAVEQSEQRQRALMEGFVNASVSRVDRAHRADLQTLRGEMSYFERAQNIFYKENAATQTALMAMQRPASESRQ